MVGNRGIFEGKLVGNMGNRSGLMVNIAWGGGQTGVSCSGHLYWTVVSVWSGGNEEEQNYAWRVNVETGKRCDEYF